MTDFKPINDDHAVTAVLFTLTLDEFVEPPTLHDAAANPSLSWRSDLPAVSSIGPVQINIAGQTLEAPAAQFAILRPDGRPLWALRLSGFEIVVECTAYSRWAEVWAKAQTYLTDAFKLLKTHQSDANILEFKLSVTDRFTTTEDQYDLSSLFTDNSVLKLDMFAGRKIWHSNSGWFDSIGDLRVVDNFNIQARGKTSSDGLPSAPYTVTISHSQRASAWPVPNTKVERMAEVIELLHARNKAELAKILTQETLDRIGLPRA